MARRVVAAYRAVVVVDEEGGGGGGGGGTTTTASRAGVEWDGISEVFPWARADADPFLYPEVKKHVHSQPQSYKPP